METIDPVAAPAAPPAPVVDPIAELTRAVAELTLEVRQLRREQVHPGAKALTVTQACARLGCKKSTVHALLAEKRLKRAAKVGRLVMVTLESVLAVLAGDELPAPTRRVQRRAPVDAAAVRALMKF